MSEARSEAGSEVSECSGPHRVRRVKSSAARQLGWLLRQEMALEEEHDTSSTLLTPYAPATRARRAERASNEALDRAEVPMRV